MPYADLTVQDPNPVKRWLQRRRFADALSLLTGVPWSGPPRILDYGAGDGELALQAIRVGFRDVTLFEPTPALMAEARARLASEPGLTFLQRLDGTACETFDCVFCLEVFEHLPQAETATAVAEIHRLMKPGGLAVIGVPHEIFLPALLKGLFRMVRRYGEFDANPRNVAAAAIGRPPSRPVAEITRGLSYHFHHLGFDHRVLKRSLQERFEVIRESCSPIPVLGSFLNSEVYFLVQKRRGSGSGDAEAPNAR